VSTVVLVDPHPVVRVGLRALLQGLPEVQVVGACPDGPSALQVCVERHPDLVITEVSLPGMDGVELCRAVKGHDLRTEVLILTADDREQTAFEAIRAGAAGYVLKDVSPENLVQAVQAVLRGETVMHPRICRGVLERFDRLSQDREASHADRESLSAREIEILTEVARGATNKEIARKPFVSESTVKSRLRVIFRKISARDRAEAAAYAARKGYVR
jgi:DNA-binding NarL/FixJ family response regulator